MRDNDLFPKGSHFINKHKTDVKLKRFVSAEELRFVFSGQKAVMAIAIALLVVVSVLDGLSMTAILPLLNFIIKGNEAGFAGGNVTKKVFSVMTGAGIPLTLLSLSSMILALFVLKAALKLGTRWYVVYMQNRFEDRLIHRLFSATLGANIFFHSRTKQGAYINAFTEDVAKASTVMISISDISALFFTIMIYITITMMISGPLTVLSVTASLLLLLPLQIITRLGYRYSDQLVTDRHDFTSYLLEIKSGIKFVKSLGSKLNLISRQFEELRKKLYKSRFRVVFFSNSLTIWGEPLGIVVILATIFAGLNLFRIGAAELLIFLILYVRMVPMINGLSASMGELWTKLPSVNRVRKYINNAAVEREREDGILPDSEGYDIEFDSVCFGYDSRRILNNVNFVVRQNECVLIKGPSGAGKSTILDLIMGLYKPTGGQILVNGTPLDTLDLLHWRGKIAYVPQDCFLFNDSILRNVCLRLGEENLEEAKSAASKVEADRFIDERAEGYQTVLGERGINLSGGQKQRLALARALIPLPKILILDEPTNALDKESEENIFQCISQLKGKMTIILVTHSREMRRVESDKVLVIENGNVKISQSSPIAGVKV